MFLFLFSRAENLILFQPTHENSEKLADGSKFTKWYIDGKYSGWKRLTDKDSRTWLYIHGNAGQAIHRLYAENCFDVNDNIFILEFPGYGERKGIPSKESFNKAALEAYCYLNDKFSESKICILGVSIGSGPACYLAEKDVSPEKIVLITPFDKLANVAKEIIPFLPVSLFMDNKWDNVNAIKTYNGLIEIYGAKKDRVIPVKHAVNLSKANKNTKLLLIPCGHNEWPYFVKLKRQED